MRAEEQPVVIIYEHAGSGNHGCEAIAATVVAGLRKEAERNGIPQEAYAAPFLASHDTAQDERYGLDSAVARGDCRLLQERILKRGSLRHLFYHALQLTEIDDAAKERFRLRDALGTVAWNRQGGQRRPVAIAIGGDNYCYPEMVPDLCRAHALFRERLCRTVLYGCSIEPAFLHDAQFGGLLRDDLKRYDRIVARESLSYRALLEAGIEKDRLFLAPDPAFSLEAREVPLPEGFVRGKTIGINVSPLVQEKERVSGITMEAYRGLMRCILERTQAKIALIPHVVWESNDDRKPLRALYEAFRDTGRVLLIDDGDAASLKWIIGACSLFIGARTHATIAAYSSCVPTLVLGYSVKSRGIAADLFGMEAHYVLPVDEMKKPGELTEAFEWLFSNASRIRSELTEIMPSYRAQALTGFREILGTEDAE